jgi:hypothetical protein
LEKSKRNNNAEFEPYDQNDLKKVSEILSNLENGIR